MERTADYETNRQGELEKRQRENEVAVTDTVSGIKRACILAPILHGRRGAERNACETAVDEFQSVEEMLRTPRAHRRFRRSLDTVFVSIVNVIAAKLREELIWSVGGNQFVDVYDHGTNANVKTPLQTVLKYVRAISRAHVRGTLARHASR